MAIPGGAKRPAGWMSEVREGRTYLIETTDEKYALVRVLEITDKGAKLQYIYQPTGGPKFEVPAAPLIDLNETASKPAETPATEPSTVAEAPPAPVARGATSLSPGGVVGSSGSPGGAVIRLNDGPKTPSSGTILEPYISTHLRQRQLLIETRLKTLRAPAKTPAQIEKKIDAINDVVLLHADEAVDVLVEQIAFINPRDVGKEFQDSVHPCFAALKKMGKPASDAAVKALKRIDVNSTAPADSLESPAYKARLLGLVIRGVEGDAVGEFILKRERDSNTDQSRRAMYDQLVQTAK
jgi:hypothetical protein